MCSLHAFNATKDRRTILGFKVGGKPFFVLSCLSAARRRTNRQRKQHTRKTIDNRYQYLFFYLLLARTPTLRPQLLVMNVRYKIPFVSIKSIFS